MKEFVITLLFGWLGVHKFMQKRYVLGVVYLFTLGLCGIGWIVDTITAFKRMADGRQQKSTVNEKRSDCSGRGTAYPPAGKRLVKSFDTIILRTTGKCKLDPDDKRQDIIEYIRPKWELYLQCYEDGNKHGYYVCHPNGDDIGCLNTDIAEEIYGKYRDCELKVIVVSREYDNNDNLTLKIKIDIYTDRKTIETNWAEILEQEQTNKDGKIAIISFDTIIVGTFAECSLNSDIEREDVIEQINLKEKLLLQYWTFEGKPAYYVVRSNGLDAGCIPETLADFLYKNYENCEFEVTAIKEDLDEYGNDTFNIRIDVY